MSFTQPSAGQRDDRDAALEDEALYQRAVDMLPEAFHHHLICALWSSVDAKGTPLDAAYSVDDITAEAKRELETDLDDYIKSTIAIITANNMSPAQVGHDFWLTRNGHGAGFWDRGLGTDGEELTKAAKVYGGVDLYVGDDGLVHL